MYLTFVDSWQVYAKPLKQMKNWAEEQAEEGRDEEDGGSPPTTDVSGNHMPVSGESGQDVGTPQESLQEREQETKDDTGQAEETAPEALEETTGAVTSRGPEEVEYLSVEDDYFSDAVFIGDSRTVGMYEYGGLEEISTFYASTGLTVYKLFDSPIVKIPGQKEKQTIEEALSERSFSKIYLMIGINEMGTGTVETFMQKYKEAVEHLKELQPEAIIYLQGIMKVTSERSGQGDYITNEGIEARNEEIAKLADYVRVYYLDVNPLICDDTGGLDPSYTFDGVHLKAQYIPIWKDFLKTHVPVLPAS